MPPLEVATAPNEPVVHCDVVIAGAGPTGLMLAAELALAGVEVLVIERRPDQQVLGSRAGGLHARTIEVLAQRGVADRFLAEGQAMQVSMFAGQVVDISDFPSRTPHGLALWQNRIEAILAGWVEELPVRFRRSEEVTGFAQDDDGVLVQLAGGDAVRARYLVGCDGGRSTVRKLAGIPFTGTEPSVSWLIAEARMAQTPQLGLRRDARGQHAIGPSGEPGLFRIVAHEVEVHPGEAASLEALREAMVAVWGTDFGVHDAHWISRFTDAARQAERYRQGRVLIAGDAAHVHSPVGGQGLGIGVQDAVNLGWKLASVVKGQAPATLLDSYEAERAPVAARVLQMTLAQTAIMASDPRTDALRELVGELTAGDEPRRQLGGLLSGLDVHYDLDGAHPLVGRRMPDRDLTTADGDTTVFGLLRAARGLLIAFGGQPGAAEPHAQIGPWLDRVLYVRALSPGRWELPVIGEVDAPEAVLVRPDGHVAWVGAEADPALGAALGQWFGPAER